MLINTPSNQGCIYGPHGTNRVYVVLRRKYFIYK
jgi:hypothetical protein